MGQAGGAAADPAAGWPVPPVVTVPPSIERWRDGNTGCPFVWRFDGAEPGRTLLLQALTHGNEYCGAIALDELLADWTAHGRRPLRGSLVVAFANVDAFARFDPAAPDASRFVDEDLNRVWSDAVLDDPARDSAELRRARALRPFVDAADWMLDIHSMREPCEPLMVCGAHGRGGEKAAALARRLGLPRVLLIDTGHPAGLRMIERGAFGDAACNDKLALLIECGQHWEAAAPAVAREAVARMLHLAGIAPYPGLADGAPLPPSAAPQRTLLVSEPVVARSAAFAFVRPFGGLETIARAGTLIATDGAIEHRTPHDDCVLVMPGMTHRKPGNTMVRLGRYID
jgi:predicted deacylase